jgi:hypothetical protein
MCAQVARVARAAEFAQAGSQHGPVKFGLHVLSLQPYPVPVTIHFTAPTPDHNTADRRPTTARGFAAMGDDNTKR